MYLVKKVYVGFMRLIVGTFSVVRAYISGFIEGYKSAKKQ